MDCYCFNLWWFANVSLYLLVRISHVRFNSSDMHTHLVDVFDVSRYETCAHVTTSEH